MNTIDKNIAANLRRIRKSKNMSLDTLAEKTGVSKSMLGQIERGESNPTVTTIGKIVEGLKITYEEMLYVKEEDVMLVDGAVIPAYREKQGKYQIKQIFAFDQKRRFEMYSISIEAGEVCGRITDTEGTCEYITVMSGELLVRVGNHEYKVKEGQSMRLLSEVEHCYCNKQKEVLQMNLILSYENNPYQM